MRVKTQCPRCGRPLMVREDDLGQERRCPHCRETVTLTRPAPAAARPRPTQAPSPVPPQVHEEADEPIPLAPEDVVIFPPRAAQVGPRVVGPTTPQPVGEAFGQPPQGPIPSPFYVGPGYSASRQPVVPTVVRVYGLIIMILNGIGMGLAIVGTIVGCVQVASLRSLAPAVRRVAYVFLFLRGGLGFAINVAFYVLGKRLRAGSRVAVIILCVLAGLAALGLGLVLLVATSVPDPVVRAMALLLGLIGLGVVGVLYVPPIVSAFRHWDQFH